MELKRFDITNVGDKGVIFIIGSRAVGKTTLVRDLLYHKNHIQTHMIIDTCKNIYNSYDDIICSDSIYDSYNEDRVASFINQQHAKIYENRKEMFLCRGKSSIINTNSAVFIVDDLYEQSMLKDKTISNIMYNSSGYNCLSIFIMQYPIIPVSLRNSANYVFIYRENIVNNRRKIYNQYCGMFETFEEFSQIMDNLKKYECLVIDNTTDSNKLEDIVFIYKAVTHTEFKLNSYTEPIVVEPVVIEPVAIESVVFEHVEPVVIEPVTDTVIGSVYKYIYSFFSD